MSHLLPLSALHAAAPGVLDVIFGADGDFEGAPLWRPPLWGTLRPRKGNQPDADDGQTGFVFRYTLNTAMRGNADLAVVMDGPAAIWGIGGAALDCRIPSVAARLAGLCARADPDADRRRQLQMMFGDLRKPVSTGDAVALASLTLSLAPRIVALKSPA